MIKINRQKAERLFNEGKEIIIIACKLRVGAPWHPECRLKVEPPDGLPILHGFQDRVNNFKFYNCTYETGYYPHYYIEA